MKPLFLILFIVVYLSAFTITDNNKKIFKQLYALKGTWKMNTKQGAICEEWKKINSNYLQSKGYIIKGIDTITTERVALTKNATGIFYTSTVQEQNNKQPIAFKMTSAANGKFIFENPQHDFPKRIVYELITADSLHAYVDEGNDESKKRQHFYYKRQ